MKRLIALITLGVGTAALAQAPPPAAPAKKVIVHKKVVTHAHRRTVTHRPSPTGVGHTNVVVRKSVATPNGTHTRVITKATTHKPIS